MIQHRGAPQMLDYHVSAVQAELTVVSDEPVAAAGTLTLQHQHFAYRLMWKRKVQWAVDYREWWGWCRCLTFLKPRYRICSSLREKRVWASSCSRPSGRWRTADSSSSSSTLSGTEEGKRSDAGTRWCKWAILRAESQLQLKYQPLLIK